MVAVGGGLWCNIPQEAIIIIIYIALKKYNCIYTVIHTHTCNTRGSGRNMKFEMRRLIYAHALCMLDIAPAGLIRCLYIIIYTCGRDI